MLQLILIVSILSLLTSSYALWQLVPRVFKKAGSTVLLDTSALMDGRILEVVRLGFVPSSLVVPRFVIAELQLLADKADHLKRERARFGLQVIQDLKNTAYVNISIVSDDVKDEAGVDEKLVKLALKQKALLFTTDYNLLKVAEIEGIKVLNVNELAQNLRPTHIPGEQLEIKVVAHGQEKSQGVGYLDDGTMVVIEKAGNQQGKKLRIEVTRALQTTAGRMMFAKPLGLKTRQARSKSSSNSSKKMNAEDQLIATINNL